MNRINTVLLGIGLAAGLAADLLPLEEEIPGYEYCRVKTFAGS